MTENTRLSGSIGQIGLGLVEREATPRLLMTFRIQLHLAGLSLSNTVSILEIFGVKHVDQPFIIGFTRPIYNPRSGGARNTLRLMRP
jgi:hypothetical protein